MKSADLIRAKPNVEKETAQHVGRYCHMYAKPMILPLDANGRIYALQDEKGNTIGTGTREVCEVLLHIIAQAANDGSGPSKDRGSRPNVRAAISM